MADPRPGATTKVAPPKAAPAHTPVARTPLSRTPVSRTPVARTPLSRTPVSRTPVSRTPETAPAAEVAQTPPPPSLGELVATASEQMSVLVRSEIELAKLELKVEAKKAAVGAGGLAAAAFLGLFALLMLSFAAAYGLNSAGLAKGWSFLIVGGTYLLLAGILGFGGAKSMTRIGPPERTLRTTKETVKVLRDRGRAAAGPAGGGA